MSDLPGLLVTGASGFVGRHIVNAGQDRFTILATGRGNRPEWLPDAAGWRTVDLLDRTSVNTLPDDLPYVIHLASETVPARFAGYDPLIDSVEMTLNLCRHLRAGRLLFVSSCLVYGADTHPLDEAAPIAPRGFYGLAKAMGETIALGASDIDAAVARPFNHIGTGMRPDLVIPSIVRRVRAAGDGETITMSGLDSIRDFLDVADIVEAYFAILALSGSETRVFNVASGTATSIDDIVRTVAHVLDKPIGGVEFAASANSPDDSSIIVGDAKRLRAATGWVPRIPLEQALRRLADSV